MIHGSPGAYTIDGAKIVVSRSASSTACSASAFARKKRAGECSDAPIAEKKMNRFDARPLGGAHEPERRDGVELLDRAAGLVADRRGQVHDRVDAAHRVAERRGVAEVAQRDLHAHALRARAAAARERGSAPARPPR